MDKNFTALKEHALKILRSACREGGILAVAETEETENYTRVWARDSVMTGLAGLQWDDEVVTEGLRQSLNTLRANQSPVGFMPSNVSLGTDAKVSYGGTAGRVDATLWYIIGVLKYYDKTKDGAFFDEHLQALEKAIDLTYAWEYNGKHLIYTPLSGNWADEFPLHGYTLYDNCLRLWGLKLYDQVLASIKYKQKKEQIESTIKTNFFIKEEQKGVYHPTLYNRQITSYPFLLAGFNPARYYTFFDAGGNGLALSLGLYDDQQIKDFASYIESLYQEINIQLAPAFWPVITDDDPLAFDLQSNYAYSFKNKPYHFHNGGIWPIMNGWLALGLSDRGQKEICQNMIEEYSKFEINENYQFSEYISADFKKPGGKINLCFSASGALMMLKAIEI